MILTESDKELKGNETKGSAWLKRPTGQEEYCAGPGQTLHEKNDPLGLMIIKDSEDHTSHSDLISIFRIFRMFFF